MHNLNHNQNGHRNRKDRSKPVNHGTYNNHHNEIEYNHNNWNNYISYNDHNNQSIMMSIIVVINDCNRYNNH